MKLKDKPLPKFEVPASYEKYAQGGYLMNVEAAESDTFAEHVPASAPGVVRSAHAPAKDARCAGDAQDAAVAEEETLEARVSKVIMCVGAQNSLREVLYKTLAFCQDAHEFTEVEDFIVVQDEFVYSHIMQTPFTLIEMLLRAGGLFQEAIDAQGNVLSDEQLAALPDDEADELIATYRIQATEAGRQAVRLLSPEHRIEAQLELRPHRRDTYFAVLDFCQQPRTFPEIEAFFKSTPDLVQDVVAHHHKLSPDFYVDKLDKAGALVWRGAWVVTDAGKRMLAEHERGEDVIETPHGY